MADTLLFLQAGRMQPKQVAGQVYASNSGFGGVRTAQVEPPRLELTRAGRRFATSTTSGVTGIAPVQAMPTTAAQWALFNTSTTDSMAFEKLGVLLASGTAGAGIQVIAAFFTTPAQTGFATGVQVGNLSNSTRTSAMAIKSGVTITAPSTVVWFHVAKSDTANTAVLSVAAINDCVDGGIILPPSTGLALAVLSPAGTSPLYVPVAQWVEAAQDLE